MNITGGFQSRQGVNYTILGWQSGAFYETVTGGAGTAAARDDSGSKDWSYTYFNASRSWTGINYLYFI